MFIDHAAEAEIVDARVPDRAVDPEAVIEIVGDLIVVVAAVHGLIARALVESPVLVASLRTGRKTVVPNQGISCECNCRMIYFDRNIM